MTTTLDPVKSRKPAKRHEDGTMLLPREVADSLGNFSDNDILLFRTEQGVLVTTREKLFLGALEGIGAALRESGVTLEELMESGAEIRQELVDEFYPRRAPE